MSKIATYLAEHLRGEVITNASARESYSIDGSIIKVVPLVLAFPYNTSDIRKIAHFAWQLAEKGHTLPITARGNGTSKTGAAIGAGIVISFPTHFNKILEVDTKQKLVRLQPGVSLRNLKEAMQTHGLTWPVSGCESESTVGGAVMNNLYGKMAGKYGDASVWVDQIELILPNGDVIQTGRMNKRELNKRKGLSTAEGELYRNLDGLINDKAETIAGMKDKLGSAGYNIAAVKDSKGNFDLTPLVAGSQGTLGIMTELILKLDVYHPQIEVIAAPLKSLDNFESLIGSIQKQNPSKFEYLDGDTLRYARDNFGTSIDELIDDNDSLDDIAGLLLIEFDDSAKSKAKKVAKMFDKAGYTVVKSEGDYEAAQEILQLFSRIERSITSGDAGHKLALPVIEDVLVAPDDVNDFIVSAKDILKTHRIGGLFTAHMSTGVVHARALLNIRSLTDKQKIAKLISDYYTHALSVGGSVSGEYGEGRLRVTQAIGQFTSEEKDLLDQVKSIFDNHGILNPEVKLQTVTSKDPLSRLNEDYDNFRSSESLSSL